MGASHRLLLGDCGKTSADRTGALGGECCGFLVPHYIEIIFEHCSVDIPLDTFVHNLVNTGLLCFQCLRSTPDVNIRLINVRI